MRKFTLAALTLGTTAIMQLTLGAITSLAEPLPVVRGVKIGKIQYRNSETAKEAKLEHGRSYPGNPSVQPAVPANTTLQGQALVADAFSTPGIVLRPR